MDDAFHASENEHNREVFTAYIHATLCVSRAEWLAEVMQIAIKPLRRQFKHIEPNNAGNPSATKALRDWHAEKEKIKAAKEGVKIKHTEITEEDKAWEQPDVAGFLLALEFWGQAIVRHLRLGFRVVVVGRLFWVFVGDLGLKAVRFLPFCVLRLWGVAGVGFGARFVRIG